MVHLALHLWLLLLSGPIHGSQEMGKHCSHSAFMLRVSRTRMGGGVQRRRLRKNSGAFHDTEEPRPPLSETRVHREA